MIVWKKLINGNMNEFEKVYPNDSAFARGGSQSATSRHGLTKREYFASLAMQGILSQARLKTIDDYKAIVTGSIIIADKLIKQLNEKPCQQVE